MAWEWPHPEDYAAARPFPHAVLDGFIAPEWAEKVAAEFPPCDDNPVYDDAGRFVGNQGTAAHDPRWHHFSSPVEEKWQCSDPAAFGRETMILYDWLMSPRLTLNIERLVGVKRDRSGRGGLVGSVFGGGYHLIRPGGFLGMHTDSLHDPDGEHWESSWYRCVNLLVFLTDNEGDETADLWLVKKAGPGEGEVPRSISPKPGRAVIFTTTGDTLHGHPEPLRGLKLVGGSTVPVSRDRRSFAAYYYRETPPPWWTGDQFATTFV